MKSEIVSRKWRKYVCSNNPGITEISPPIDDFYSKKYNIANYASFELQNFRLAKYLRKMDIDLIQVHGETVPFFPHTPLPIYHPWMVVKKPICLTIHALWSLYKKEPYITRSESMILNRANHIIVVERFLKEYIIKNFNIAESKISFLPSSIAPERVNNQESFLLLKKKNRQ